MKDLLATDLAKVLTVLPLVMLANNLFGAVLAEFINKYDKDKLKAGMFKGLIVYLGIGLFVIVSLYLPDLSINFNGTDYTLINAIYVIIWGTVIAYSYDGINKLAKIFNYKTGDIEDEA